MNKIHTISEGGKIDNHVVFTIKHIIYCNELLYLEKEKLSQQKLFGRNLDNKIYPSTSTKQHDFSFFRKMSPSTSIFIGTV